MRGFLEITLEQIMATVQRDEHENKGFVLVSCSLLEAPSPLTPPQSLPPGQPR